MELQRASTLEVHINTAATPAIVAGTWVSVGIDITSLGDCDKYLTGSDIAQIGITTANGIGTLYYDNIYFYK